MYDVQRKIIQDSIDKYGVEIGITIDTDTPATKFTRALPKHRNQIIADSTYLQTYNDTIIFTTLDECKGYITKGRDVYTIVGDLSNIEGIHMYNCTFKISHDYNITLSESSASVKECKTYQITATCTKDNSTVENPTIIYSSLDEDIATVNDKGLVTANKQGTTQIICKFGNSTATLELNVVGIVYTLDVEQIGQLNNGDTKQVVYTCKADDVVVESPTGVTFSIDNTSVATVNDTGLITTLATSTFNLTVLWNDISNTQTIEVVQVSEPTFIWMVQNETKLNDGDSYSISRYTQRDFQCRKMLGAKELDVTFTYEFETDVTATSIVVTNGTGEDGKAKITIRNKTLLTGAGVLHALVDGVSVSTLNINFVK